MGIKIKSLLVIINCLMMNKKWLKATQPIISNQSIEEDKKNQNNCEEIVLIVKKKIINIRFLNRKLINNVLKCQLILNGKRKWRRYWKI